MDKTYTYAIARIRALEAKMLSPAQVNRMVEAPDLGRAFFVLNETAYADHISASANPFNYEDIIKAELTRTYNFLNYYAGEDEIMLRLWRKYDYGNAKLLIRAQKKETEEVEELLSDFGVIDKDRLTSFIMKGEGSVPVWLEKPIGEAILVFEAEKNPAEIDRILDGSYLNDLITSENDVLKKLGALYQTVKFPVDLEGDNKAVDLLKGVKRRSFGVGPLLAFWLAKGLEVKAIRQILIAKKHHLATALIKERIRSVYA